MPLDPISYSLIKKKDYVTGTSVVYSPTEPEDKTVIWFDTNIRKPKIYDNQSGKWGILEYYLEHNVGYSDFDNNVGGVWTNYINIPITTSPSESVQYKIEINVDNINVYSNDGTTVLTTGTGGLDFWGKVQTDGKDIRVFDETYSQNYFWVEKFDYVHHKAIIWVKIDAGQEQVNIAYGNDDCLISTYNDIYSVLTESVSNLIGCWHFDENIGTTTQDFSGHGHDGILNGSVSWTTNGYHGNAISFNGGYVQIDNSTGMDGYKQLTVVCRVYPTKWSSNYYLLIFNKENCYELGIDYHGVIQWAVHNSSFWSWINTGITLNLNEWYTIFWIYESSSSIKTYVYDSNGNLTTHTGSFGSGNIRTSSYSLRIGSRTLFNDHFNGIIDEVYMFDRALSQTEIEMIRRGICRGNNNGVLLTCKYLSSDLSFVTPTIKEF